MKVTRVQVGKKSTLLIIAGRKNSSTHFCWMCYATTDRLWNRLYDVSSFYPNAFSSYLFDLVSKRCYIVNLLQNCYQRLKEFNWIKIWDTPGHAIPAQWPAECDPLLWRKLNCWPCFSCVTDAIADPNGEIAPVPVSRRQWRHNLIIGLKRTMSGHADPCKRHKLQYIQIFFVFVFFFFHFIVSHLWCNRNEDHICDASVNIYLSD